MAASLNLQRRGLVVSLVAPPAPQRSALTMALDPWGGDLLRRIWIDLQPIQHSRQVTQFTRTYPCHSQPRLNSAAYLPLECFCCAASERKTIYILASDWGDSRAWDSVNYWREALTQLEALDLLQHAVGCLLVSLLQQVWIV